MNLELDGKRAVVTGGSRGIGKAIARQLALEGCDVVITARTQADLDAAASELVAETGRKVVAIACDTASDDSVRAMAKAATEALGVVDILVNNAAKPGGQGPVPRLTDITDDIFWDDVNVKVMGYLRCARELVPHMKETGWGRIINISGLAARQSGSIVGSIRNVSVSALTKNLADELTADGITVNCIHPGLTRTEKTPGVIAARAKAAGASEAEVEQQLTAGTLANRMIDATDIANVAAFLASPLAIAINGESIGAGGGQPRVIYY